MAQLDFGIAESLGPHILDIVGAVAHSLFDYGEERLRQMGVSLGAGADRHCVIAAPGLETAAENVDAGVQSQTVHALEAVHRLRHRHLRIGEEHRLSAPVIEYRGGVDVAVHPDVEIAEHGHRHEIALVAHGGVHLEAICVIVEEVAGIGVLRSG